jgi:hypothetical protein
MTMKMRKGKQPTGNYEVGYARPPKEHQFKKGEPSRNARGRPPKKTRVPKSQIVEVMTEAVTIKIEGREQKVPFPIAFFQLLKSKALQGEAKATRTVIELLREMGLLDDLRHTEGMKIIVEYVDPKDPGPKTGKRRRNP